MNQENADSVQVKTHSDELYAIQEIVMSYR